MKKIKLTQGKFALIDDEDFERVNKYKWCYGNREYAIRTSYKPLKVIYMHRFIMNTSSDKNLDHIDGNRINNQKNNLREATHSENMLNRKTHKNNSTGFKGVTSYQVKKTHVVKYRARIQKNNKIKTIGYFNTPEDAYKAYYKTAKKTFGEFMRREI